MLTNILRSVTFLVVVCAMIGAFGTYKVLAQTCYGGFCDSYPTGCGKFSGWRTSGSTSRCSSQCYNAWTGQCTCYVSVCYTQTGSCPPSMGDLYTDDCGGYDPCPCDGF